MTQLTGYDFDQSTLYSLYFFIVTITGLAQRLNQQVDTVRSELTLNERLAVFLP